MSVDLSAIDWSMRDVDIARQTGLTRERVRQRRRLEADDISIFKGKSDAFIKAAGLVSAFQGECIPCRVAALSEFFGIRMATATWSSVLNYCGKTARGAAARINTVEQLEEVLDKSQECWRLTVGDLGDGALRHPTYRHEYTRRLAYRILCRPLNPGECLLSTCKNKKCCRPSHMIVCSSRAEVSSLVRRRERLRKGYSER